MKRPKAVASDSREQRGAEPEMLAALSTQLGVSLAAKVYDLGGARLKIDGAADGPDGHPILCEACAHHGAVKAGQARKIIADAFKLVYAERALGVKARKVILLADEDAARAFRGKGWVAAAFRALEIEVHVVSLPPEVSERVREAQARQYR